MNKLLWGLAAAVALIPAAIGLLGNPSLGESVPVQVPSSAEVVSTAGQPSATPSASRSSDDVAGEDHGGSPGSGSDHPTGDDHGGMRSSDTGGSDHPAGDDHGGMRSSSPTAAAGNPGSTPGSDDRTGNHHGGGHDGGTDDTQPHH